MLGAPHGAEGATRAFLYVSPLAMVALTASGCTLASQHGDTLVLSLFFAAKAWFGMFLFARARLLYAAMRRSMGFQGAASFLVVVLGFAIGLVQFTDERIREFVFLPERRASRGGLERLEKGHTAIVLWATLLMSATVAVDVAVVVLALRLYASPVANAVLVSATAGLTTDAAHYRLLLKRHLTLCALSVVSTCWVWASLVLAVVPSVCLCAFIVWWHKVLVRTRVDAISAFVWLATGQGGSGDVSPREISPPSCFDDHGRVYLARGAAITLFLGVLAPFALAYATAGLSFNTLTYFMCADMAVHTLLVGLFLRAPRRLTDQRRSQQYHEQQQQRRRDAGRSTSNGTTPETSSTTTTTATTRDILKDEAAAEAAEGSSSKRELPTNSSDPGAAARRDALPTQEEAPPCSSSSSSSSYEPPPRSTRGSCAAWPSSLSSGGEQVEMGAWRLQTAACV